MKNIEHFGDLTPRMNDFREKVLDKKPYICACLLYTSDAADD